MMRKSISKLSGVASPAVAGKATFRRNLKFFLGATSAVSAMTITAVACSSPAKSHESSGQAQRPSATGHPYPNSRTTDPRSDSHSADVIIVGAGISGLACAAALQKRGLSVILLEASHHVGGRIRQVNELEFAELQSHKKDGDNGTRSGGSHGATSATPEGVVEVPEHHTRWLTTFGRLAGSGSSNNSTAAFGSTDYLMDVGGEFIHGPKSEMAVELEERGVAYTELFTWAHGDGGPSEEPAHDAGVGYYYDGFTRRLSNFSDHLKEHGTVIERLWAQGDREEAQADADRRSLRQYLLDGGANSDGLAFAESGYANTVGGTLDRISAALMARCERNWNARDGEGDFRVSGNATLHSLVRSMVEAHRLDIRTASPVEHIKVHGQQDGGESSSSSTSSGVELRTRGGEVFKARACVVTAPVPALQRGIIEFEPPLAEATSKAIASLQCEPAFKYFLKFEKRFWPKDAHGCICSNAFAPEVWFDCKDDEAGPCYATAFFTSDNARRAANTPVDTAVAALRLQLQDMFGEAKNRSAGSKIDDGFIGGFSINWGAVPWIWGGYTTPALTENLDARSTISGPQFGGRVRFAGEGVFQDSYMTANAAFASGLSAAAGIESFLREAESS